MEVDDAGIVVIFTEGSCFHCSCAYKFLMAQKKCIEHLQEIYFNTLMTYKLTTF